MTVATATPGADELVGRAREVVPTLREHARWSDENRRLADASVQAIIDSGLLRMRTPRRYGGYEAGADTLREVLAELSRGDGAAGWVASVWTIPGWMVGMFPDEVQAEVHATPDVRVCGTLSPSGSVTPTDGGYRLTGRWSFVSGALHSQWQQIVAMGEAPDRTPMPVIGLVPMSELTVVDDWHTNGMRGSGSVSTVASDVFVPAERVLPMPVVLEGRPVSEHSASLPLYRAPLLGIAALGPASVVSGLTRAAWDGFLERIGTRGITYTDYERQADAPVTHLLAAEVARKRDYVDFHARRLGELVDRKGITGEPWTLEERARGRADVGAACEQAVDAISRIASASGATSLQDGVAIRRLQNDAQAIGLHALTVPSTAAELHGRVLCGLAPNTPYL